MKKITIIDITMFIFFYLYSYILISNYIYGDQESYRKLYDVFSDSNFSNILLDSYGVVGSSEPISVFILWLGSFLSINKDFYISFFDAVLLFGLFKIFRKRELGVFFGILLLTNFYIIVLLTGAERLKFSFIFIIYYYLFIENKSLSFSLLLLAIFSHFQTFLFILGIGSYASLGFLKDIFFRRVVKYYYIIIFVSIILCTVIITVFFGDILLSKIQYYMNKGSFSSLLKLPLLLVVSLLSTRNKANMAVMIISFFPIVYLLGGDRVNMIVFMLVLLKLMAEGRANQPVFMVLMAYFTFKSFGFVYNIFVYGNGFYS